jgi:hypothetical protein
MFNLTDETTINLTFISSVGYFINYDSVPGKTDEDKFLYQLLPYLTVTMNNGTEHKVNGLKDIHAFLLETQGKRMWNALIAKLRKELEGNADESYFLNKEDSSYLTKSIF